MSAEMPMGQDLLDAVTSEMPFGKFKGRRLIDVPEEYLVWMHSKGFPKSKIGQQLALIYEIKLNGLEQEVIKACRAHGK